jgi:hypothetical protein
MIRPPPPPTRRFPVPYHWTRIPTGTPPDLKDLSPAKFKRRIHEKVKEAGGALDELYFTRDGSEAWAMIHLPEARADLGEALKSSLEAREGYDLVVAEELRADWRSGGGKAA